MTDTAQQEKYEEACRQAKEAGAVLHGGPHDGERVPVTGLWHEDLSGGMVHQYSWQENYDPEGPTVEYWGKYEQTSKLVDGEWVKVEL